MKQIHFVASAWSKGRDHPVYQLLRDNPPDGWQFGLPGDDNADLVVVPTRPWYDGKRPWLILIEDWTTLYNEDLLNGATGTVDVLNHPKTRALRTQFDHPNFKGIVCHHRGTFLDLVHLRLTDRLFYAPVGVPRRDPRAVSRPGHTSFLFINSWKAGDGNFTCRGGQLVLCAFRELWQDGHRDLSLKVCCELPAGLASDLRQFALTCPGMAVLQHHLPNAELEDKVRESDCLLLPSHRVHVHSILLPFSLGLPVISSDGWGNDEYVIAGVNGFRIAGVWGKTSWHDGVLREDYSRWRDTLPAVAELKDRMLELHRNRPLLARMRRAAYDYANDVHPIARQQRLLQSIFDESCL